MMAYGGGGGWSQWGRPSWMPRWSVFCVTHVPLPQRPAPQGDIVHLRRSMVGDRSEQKLHDGESYVVPDLTGVTR
jgi:hypothetical protein